MASIYTDIHIQGGLQNVSLQIGDIVYKLDGETLVMVGPLQAIFDTGVLRIENVNFVDLSSEDFLVFAKDSAVNNNSLTGYYAKVEMENTSTDQIELFALSSEATHSSK